MLNALTAEVEHGVACPDVGEEGVAEALALGGALHQPGDVGHVQEGGDLAANKQKIVKNHEKRKKTQIGI